MLHTFYLLVDRLIPDCNPALHIKHGTVSFENKVAGVVKIGSKSSFRCNKGYVLYGEAMSTCESSNREKEHGQWSATVPVCYGKEWFGGRYSKRMKKGMMDEK